MAEARERERGTKHWMSASGAALALAAGMPAEAATFQVSNLDDAGAGSLRQALLDANATAGADTITFQAGLTGTVLLTSGQLSIEDSVNIQGPGPSVLTVSGNDSSRVFYVYDPASTLDVTISGLTLADGAGSPGGVVVDWGENLTLDNVVVTGGNSPTVGGGIAVLGSDNPGPFSFTLRDSVVSGNSAGESGGALFLDEADATFLIQNSSLTGNGATDGGAISADLLAGDLTIEQSTISGNTASALGGGVHVDILYGGGSLTVRESTISGNGGTAGGGAFVGYLYGTLLLENSTLSGNSAAGLPGSPGGGLFFGYLYGGGSATVRHSTIAGNAAVQGGGIYVGVGSVGVEHTIVANNVAKVGDDLQNGSDGGFGLRFSLVETPETANIGDLGGNILGQDPQLGSLQNNSGPTQTHLPAAGSPAIDAGDPAFAPPPATDQRGAARVAQGRIDIGSVEVAASTIQLSASAYAVNENGVTVTITATRTGSTSGAVAVDFFTSPGTATSPADFLAALGTLTWEDGDGAPKSFQVTIVNDLLDEVDETFGVTLTNPQGGAALGAPFVATVTILDDEAPGSIQEIPTLGDVGKVLLVGMVGLAGLLRLRRRREQGGV